MKQLEWVSVEQKKALDLNVDVEVHNFLDSMDASVCTEEDSRGDRDCHSILSSEENVANYQTNQNKQPL